MAKKVMLVDRQKQMQNFYLKFIPWAEYGFEVFTITDNIKSALSYFGEYYHDLVICDINLIDGDGMSLVQKIKDLSNGKTKVIVISDDISYEKVRMAFKSGAEDYFIRTSVTPNDLISFLSNLDKNYQAQNFSSWKSQIEYIIGNIRDGQDYDERIFNQILNSPEFGALRKDHRIVLFRMDDVIFVNRGFPSINSSLEKSDRYFEVLKKRILLQEQIQQVLVKYLNIFQNFRLLFNKSHSCFLILEESDYYEFYKIIHNIKRDLERKSGFEFSAFISEKLTCNNKFDSDIRNLYTMMDTKFYFGNSSVIYKKKMLYEMKNENIYYNNKIIKLMKNKQFEKVKIVMIKSIEYFKEKKFYPIHIINYYLEIMNDIEEMLKNNKVLDLNDVKQFKDSLKHVENFICLEYILILFVNYLEKELEFKQLNRNSQYVFIIKKYIENNIEKKITVSDIANYLSLTTVHINRVFKGETGVTISKYIINIKMEEAAKILLSQKYKYIKEVAFKVGYFDQLYFNKLFKTHFGVSPKLFMKNNINKII